MLPMPDEDVVRTRQAMLDQATVVLNTHVPTDDGRCGGCLELWGRWVPATGCTQMAWARSIMETHGVADDLWDVSPQVRYGNGVRIAA
jgi:hypothetical protein